VPYKDRSGPGAKKHVLAVRAIQDAKAAYIRRFKQEHGCAVCGEHDYVVLELDHIDRRTKSPHLKIKNSRSRGFANLGWVKLLAELQLVQVLCANCHRRKTSAEAHA